MKRLSACALSLALSVSMILPAGAAGAAFTDVPQAVGKVQGLFRQPEKMPLLSRRSTAEKSSLRSLNALPRKAFRAFDPTRGGLPPPRPPPPILGRIRLNRGFSAA